MQKNKVLIITFLCATSINAFADNVIINNNSAPQNPNNTSFICPFTFTFAFVNPAMQTGSIKAE